MEAARVWKGILVISSALLSLLAVQGDDAAVVDKVLTLDHSNFTDVVSKHSFIVVEFYAPWCGHCKALAPEYEKAAAKLSSHDPPIVLAKVDANEESNRDLATEFQIQGFPTLKILRNGGKSIQEYKGPREADGIVDYLKKQVGPASAEIKTAEDAASVIDEKKITIIGLFPKFSGEEYESFSSVAEKLRSDYTFGHTLDAKLIPRGESVDKPTIRLLKPFDELVVDTQDFNVEAVEKFIEQSTIPIVTVWNSDPSNYDYVNKFFDSPNDKAMLFINFTTEHGAFEPKYKEVASEYKTKGISFMLGDADVTANAFQYFGLETDQAPLIIIQTADGSKYLKTKIKPEELARWIKDYKEGLVKPFIKSEPIPETNDERVKVVVRDTLQDMVFNSGKNVLLEFYAPWCGHCKNLAPILDEVAKSYENDEGVLIAKFDATANDVPKDVFDVQGFPTVYFRSSTGDLVTYDGDRTKEEIIDFIEKNRDKGVAVAADDGQKADEVKVAADDVKDEL